MSRGYINAALSAGEQRALEHYLGARLLRPATIVPPPRADLAAVVTVPCYDEPDISSTLASLDACTLPHDRSVEVIVLVNAPQDASVSVRERNEAAAAAVRAFTFANPRLRCFAIVDNALPRRRAGVGLARKLAMDEALLRLVAASRPNGIIMGLDADCTCDNNYLQSISQSFDSEPIAGASVYFEHPLTAMTADAITHYESYLRYYRLGLRYAGSAHAFHTVGSSMCVRAIDYARLGGMNRRQAGEDFYFLQKFMDTERFGQITGTCVRPAARLSARVPFGTGAAITAALNEDKQVPFYAPDVFDELRTFFASIDSMWQALDESLAELPERLRWFLIQQDFARAEAQIRANVAGARAYARHLRTWMNGFRCMKFARYWGETWGFVPPAEALRGLGVRLANVGLANMSAQPTLDELRRVDRAL